MSLIAFLVIGFLAGLIARALTVGNPPMDFAGSTLLGVVGAVAGGVLSSLVYSHGSGLELAPTGLIFSTLGALLLLGAVGFAGRRSVHA